MVKLSVVNALSKADSHLKKREYSAAKELYLSILKVFPNNKKAQKGLSFINKQAGTHVNQQNFQNSLNQLLNIYSQGNPDQAYDYAKSLLKQYPNAAGILNILGASAAQIGDLEAAASAFRKIISINPSQASGYYNLGNVLRDNQKFDEALEAYDKALNLKPDYEAALNNLILIIRDMYRPDDPTIQKYIKSHNIRDSIGPHTEQSDFDRGNILQQRGHFEGAIAAYSKALSIEPDNANLYNNIGIAYANLKRFDAAIEAYKKAIALEPTNASFHNNVGISYAGIGEHNVAIDAYNKALSLKSDYPEVYYNMASALSESGQLERAIWAYEQALTIRPNYASAWYNMGLKLSALGEQDRAVKAYAKVLECETDHIAASYNMAILLKDLGQWDEAIAAYRKVLSIKPDHAEAYNNMGVIFQEKNEFSAAIDAYDQAIRIQPSYTSAWYNKGMTFYEQGEFQSAIIAYRKVLSIKPDHAEAYNNMGIALSNMGQHEQAIDACKKAIEIKPDYANAYNNLGLAQKSKGLLSDSLESFDLALQLNPDNPDTYHNKSFVLLNSGSTRDGLEAYEWRWRTKHGLKWVRKFNRPMWDGKKSLRNKRLLIWSEQGIGDTLNWCSELAKLVEKAETCMLECQTKLVPLLKLSFPFIEVQPEYRRHDEIRNDFDYHIPLGTLLKYTIDQDTENLVREAYLKPQQERIDYWKNRLRRLGGAPYIGLSWKSSNVNSLRAQNYCEIRDLRPLFDLKNATFINLQYKDFETDLERLQNEFGIKVHNFDDLDHFDDLLEVAALCAALDFVVSTKITVPFISAGVGTSTKLANWKQSDWNNVLLNPKGPSIEIYERDSSADWAQVFEKIAHDISIEIQA